MHLLAFYSYASADGAEPEGTICFKAEIKTTPTPCFGRKGRAEVKRKLKKKTTNSLSPGHLSERINGGSEAHIPVATQSAILTRTPHVKKGPIKTIPIFISTVISDKNKGIIDCALRRPG